MWGVHKDPSWQGSAGCVQEYWRWASVIDVGDDGDWADKADDAVTVLSWAVSCGWSCSVM